MTNTRGNNNCVNITTIVTSCWFGEFRFIIKAVTKDLKPEFSIDLTARALVKTAYPPLILIPWVEHNGIFRY